MSVSSLPDPSAAGAASGRLSVPPKPVASRRLEDDERATLIAVADVLIPGTATDPAPSVLGDYTKWLDRALDARADVFPVIMALVGEWTGKTGVGLDSALRALAVDDPAIFNDLTSVLAGAYLMSPEIRRAIGYPGQGRNPARLEQAAEELSDGVLDPVIERGHVYVSAAGE